MEHEDPLSFDDVLLEESDIDFWEEQLEILHSLVSSGVVDDVLYNYYSEDGENFARINGIYGVDRVPILTTEEWIDTDCDADNLISSYNEEFNREYERRVIWDLGTAHASMSHNKSDVPTSVDIRDYLWNNPMYRVEEVDSSGSLTLGLTDYYSYVSTSHRAARELYEACDSHTGRVDEIVRDLPFRDDYASTFDDMRRSDFQVMSNIVAMLLEMPDGETRIPVIDRAKSNVDYPGALAVAPSGGGIPVFDASQECKLPYQIKRLVGEEIFGRGTLRVSGIERGDTSWINESVPVGVLSNQIESGETTLGVSSVGYNALNTSPQIYSYLHVQNDVFSSWIFDMVENVDRSISEGDVYTMTVDEVVSSIPERRWSPGSIVSVVGALDEVTDREVEVNIESS